MRRVGRKLVKAPVPSGGGGPDVLPRLLDTDPGVDVGNVEGDTPRCAPQLQHAHHGEAIIATAVQAHDGHGLICGMGAVEDVEGFD